MPTRIYTFFEDLKEKKKQQFREKKNFFMKF